MWSPSPEFRSGAGSRAQPSLTPAQVEDILLDTAHKFTAGGPYEADPQNPRQTTSFDKGAGVADAVAALRDPRIGLAGSGDQLRSAWDRTAAETGPNFGPTSTVLADGDGGDAEPYGAADIVDGKPRGRGRLRGRRPRRPSHG